jgi:TonB family protein
VKFLYAAAFSLLAAAACAETTPQSVYDNTCPKPDWLASDGAPSVMISFTATAQGRVEDVKVYSGNPRLDDYAIACASGWRFDPTSGMGRLDVGTDRKGILTWDKSGVGHLQFLGRRHACLNPMPKGVLPPGQSARTTVRFLITVEGKVRQPEVVQSSGYDELDKAALQCVSYWRYRPARSDAGAPVEVHDQAVLVWDGG